MGQQNTSPQQQQNKKGVFIDFETLKETKSSVDDSFMLSFVVFLLAIIGAIVVNDIVAQVIFFIIMIFSILAMGAAASSYSKLDRFTPKVKKIVKEIIFYEDGQTEEEETEYK
jgi:Na+-transporting methylmalonyl-CoA/oxaloacetate decarboxylase gamma subunit